MALRDFLVSQFVEISFDCIPLRSVGRFDIPLDATSEQQALCERIKCAAEKHGLFNTFYLCNARCVFHLTNNPDIGMVQFRFEGAVLTDQDDRKTIACDLNVELEKETCDWLTAPAVGWLKDTVSEAVKIEFDRYIEAGDLQKTIQRIERLNAEAEDRGGYMGMGL
jgi:hypothetical protein